MVDRQRDGGTTGIRANVGKHDRPDGLTKAIPLQIRRLSRATLLDRIPSARRRSAQLEAMLQGAMYEIATIGRLDQDDQELERVRTRRNAFTLNRSIRQARGAAVARQVKGQKTSVELERTWKDWTHIHGTKGARATVAEAVGVSLATIDRFLRSRVNDMGIRPSDPRGRALHRATIGRLRIALTLERAYIRALETRIAKIGAVLRASTFESWSSE